MEFFATLNTKIKVKRAIYRQKKILKAIKNDKVIQASVKGAIKQQREMAGLKTN